MGTESEVRPGTGYVTAPTVTLTASPTGDNATAVATIGNVGEYGSNNATQISSITVTHAGSGYIANTTVTVGGNGTANATANASVSFLSFIYYSLIKWLSHDVIIILSFGCPVNHVLP